MRIHYFFASIFCFLFSLMPVIGATYIPSTTIKNLLSGYRGYSNLTSAAGSNREQYALNMITWQMSHGGFDKAKENSYKNPWDGKSALSGWTTSSGAPIGTFDNNATIAEIRYLCNQYKVSSSVANKAKFKESVAKAINFIISSQYPSGAWPQVYPKRGVAYSNLATYNDNAMVRVMVLVQDIVNKTAPFDTDIITDVQRASLANVLDKCIDYTLKAQIVNDGKRTVWCQQHDPVTYAPAKAREYELPSKCASESAGIVAFLMNWPNQTMAIQTAIHDAIAWYKLVMTPDMKWQSPDFVVSKGNNLWYRFYEVQNNTPFFADRDGKKYYSIDQVSMERRTGYQWGGSYGNNIIAAYATYAPPLSVNTIDKGKSIVFVDGRDIHILNSEKPVSVYDMLGRLIYVGNERVISINNPGMYVVRVDLETRKVLVK